MDAVNQNSRLNEHGRGRNADAPTEVPKAGWKDILLRTWGEISEDRVTLIAAGVTYYLLLAMFPALTAFVSIYGLFADASTVSEHVSMLSGVLPASATQLVSEQLMRIAEAGGATLGWALLISLGIALWSASSGVKSMFEAMNVAYDETEKRNFFVLNGTALLFTLAGVVGAVVMIGVVLVIPAVLGLIGLGEGLEWLVRIAGYAVLVAVLFVGIAAVYRFGPSRQQAKWRWITPGAIVAVLVILIVSLLFSWYAANFANYEATYGSLGALIGLLTWMWISVTIVIVGGELNSEIEHQTAKDSTVGSDSPMGSRNAAMADTLGKSAGERTEDETEGKSAEWREGFEAARRRYRPQRRMSLGGLAFALPASLAMHAMQRRRDER